MGRRATAPTAVLTAALLVSLAACATQDRAEHTAPATMTILYSGWDERSVIPAWNLHPMFLLFVPLMNEDGEGERTGLVARSWEHSEDELTWTYHLRSDVRWHDGTPVTAHDVAFTVEFFSHPDVLREAPASRTVTVVDDSTVTIRYASRRARAFGHGWNVYLPRHLLAHLDPTGDWEWKDEFWPPIGYGPFRYVRDIPKTMIELEANPEWLGSRPRIDRLIVKFGGDPMIEFEAGNVDASMNLAPTLALSIARRPDFDYCLAPLWFPSAVYWNHEHVALSDVRVRRALASAIDRRELADALGYPDDIALPDVLLTPDQRSSFQVDTRPDGWEWPEDVPRPLPTDLAAASSLLEDAGWHDADGDGVRERDGTPLRFGLLTDAAKTKEAVVLQDQLRRIGAQVDIETLNRSVGQLRFAAGDFDAALTGIAPRAYGGTMFFALAGDPPGNAERPVGYFNPRLDSLVAEESEWSGNLQEESWLELQSIIRDDAVVTFLLPEIRITVFRHRIRGLTENGCNLFDAAALWIEEDQ